MKRFSLQLFMLISASIYMYIGLIVKLNCVSALITCTSLNAYICTYYFMSYND